MNLFSLIIKWMIILKKLRVTILINAYWFLQYNTNILISEDPANMLLINNKEIGDKIYSYNFGQYKNNEKPNMGMFMGYVKDLKKLAKCIISQNITDDQMALYNCFGDNIKIDTKHKIFLNTKHYE